MHVLRIKRQLIIYQLLMGIGIWFLPESIRSQNLSLIIAAICFHGIFAALQDICIDALAIRSLPRDETGKINGIMQAGMLVGRSVFGGAGVYIAHVLGLDLLVYFLIGSIWVSLIALQRTRFTREKIAKVSIRQYASDFWRLLRASGFWLLIGITYFAGFSYNGISTIGSAVLAKFDATPLQHGITYSLLLPLTMSVGALFGGYFSDLKNAPRVLQLNLIMSVLTSILTGVLMDRFLGLSPLIAGYMVFYFFIGSTTASLYGFLMKNTSREFAALEFSVFMAVVNMCDSSSSYLTGQLIEKFSYTVSAGLIGAICLICLMFIRVFQNSRDSIST